ncbi:MAG TPA: hypothetical protein PLT93_09605 [Phycisphaerae bacterium]|nr:hypothetical protein [Phycisphaerae bacterium]
MAKMYYNLDETLQKLGCNEEQLKGLVRSGKLREFRDAGKLNYKVEDVDRLVAAQSALSGSSGGELSLEDSGEISLLPDETPVAGLSLSETPPSPGRSGSDSPIDLSGSSGELRLEESGEMPAQASKGGSGTSGLKLEDSGSELRLEDSGSELKLEDSRGLGSDALSLDEVDKDRVEGMKKDDTVITNIGISVFDDEDLEIAADPMAKTMLTSGGEDHLGLDGSAGGSGLLDLTRESDDTSLGAELLEGIDMGDTAETLAPTQTADAVEPVGPAVGDEMPEPALEPVLPLGPRTVTVHYVEAASPAFTGLLVAAAIAMTLLGATVIANSMGTWPSYLAMLADNFWLSLGGMIGLGALGAGVGFLVGMKPSGPRAPKKPKEPKAPKPAKAKKGKS